MKKILIVYWPERGNVESCAIKIKTAIGQEAKLKSLKQLTDTDLKECDLLVAGCSTVGAETWKDASGENQWSLFLVSETSKFLSGKKVALFGLGDQVSYPNHYVDFMGILKKELERKGALIVGRWPAVGYKFESSEALEGDHFVGLALDEDWQPELTDERISRWVDQLKKEI